jgi:hypothetical protein
VISIVRKRNALERLLAINGELRDTLASVDYSEEVAKPVRGTFTSAQLDVAIKEAREHLRALEQVLKDLDFPDQDPVTVMYRVPETIAGSDGSRWKL